VKRKVNPRGSRQRTVRGKDFRLADEVRYILRRAANRDGRIVSIGPLVLFSTKTGDAWLLDPADHLALPLARNGDPQPFHIEESSVNFAIEWTGQYRIEANAFVYIGQNADCAATFFDYPVEQLSQPPGPKISNIFG